MNKMKRLEKTIKKGTEWQNIFGDCKNLWDIINFVENNFMPDSEDIVDQDFKIIIEPIKK